ncbi:MAG: hypothetical protein NE330_21740 [Lentisphaeraceae bacterium]|nr:hypothetical protein [Lentisphaeraceae bacterium]
MFKLLVVISLTYTSLLAQERIQLDSYRVRVNKAITTSDVIKIRQHKKWPLTEILLTKLADDQAFASLQKLPDITHLDIEYGNDKITSFKPIKYLKNLIELQTRNILKSEETPLSLNYLKGCTKLQKLILNNVTVSDPSGLTQLKKLNHLNLDNTKINSLDFLKNLKNIDSLTIETSSSNPVLNNMSMEIVGSLPEVSDLNFSSNTHITNLNALALSLELETLNARYCKNLIDIRGLQNSYFLKRVDLYNTKVRSLEGLENKIYLEYLSLSGTEIRSLTPIRKSLHLKNLSLYDTDISDISILSSMRQLEDLNVASTRVSDLSHLSQLKKLRDLSFSSSLVTSITPLRNLKNIKSLSLAKCKVSNLEPLKNFQKLNRLDISETNITDLSPLSNMAKLSSLKIKGTNITDLSALDPCHSLAYLYISKTIPLAEIDRFKKKHPNCKVYDN